MNHSILAKIGKSEIIDLDDAKAICREIKIPTTRVNLRRVRNANKMIFHDSIELDTINKDGSKHFLIQSQSTDETYRIWFNSSPATFCNCKDWKHHDRLLADQGVPFSTHLCKHGIGARLWWTQYQAERNAWSDSISQPPYEPVSCPAIGVAFGGDRERPTEISA